VQQQPLATTCSDEFVLLFLTAGRQQLISLFSQQLSMANSTKPELIRLTKTNNIAAICLISYEYTS
jgi:hypothetical protein